MKLISTQPTAGAINIPVLGTMTNEQAAKAILTGVKRSKTVLNTEQRTELDRVCTGLKSAPERIYFEYPVNCEDCFCLAYVL